MKKAVIFDMDGLMIDSERVTYEEYCRKLEQLEYHFDENMYRRCLGKNNKVSIKYLSITMEKISQSLKFGTMFMYL